MERSARNGFLTAFRWDGERFREGYNFDAEAFDAPEQAQQVLNREATDAKGFAPTVAEITDAE